MRLGFGVRRILSPASLAELCGPSFVRGQHRQPAEAAQDRVGRIVNDHVGTSLSAASAGSSASRLAASVARARLNLCRMASGEMPQTPAASAGRSPSTSTSNTRLAVGERQGADGGLDAPPGLAGDRHIERRGRRRPRWPESDQAGRVRILQHARTAVADVEIARHGEQPGPQPRVGLEVCGPGDQAQPGLLEEVFGHLAPPRQSSQEVEQPRVEAVVHGIERVGVAGAQPADQGELRLAVHAAHNAQAGQS